MTVTAAGADPRGQIGISIVISLYNKADYIGPCIDSVLAQDYGPYEIIVVDDGSTDAGPAMIKARNDCGIRLISQPNRGVSVARNVGVAAARHELVAFLDADDLWRPAHLSHLVDLARHHPDCVLFSNRHQVESDVFSVVDTPASAERMHSLSSYLENLLDGNDPVWTSAALVRKSAFDKAGGFPPGHNHGEDHALWLKLALVGSIATSAYVGALYRRNVHGLSAQVVSQPDACILLIDHMLAAGTGLSGELEWLLMELKHKYAIAHAITALLNDEREVAMRFLKISRSTRRYRAKWLILSFLCALPGYPRRGLVGLWKRYKGLA